MSDDSELSGSPEAIKPPTQSPLAFRIALYTLLVLVVLGAAAYWSRVLYYENGLREYAKELIVRASQQELLPLEPEKNDGPEVDVNCSFEPFLVGSPVGKIRLTVHPEQSSKVQRDYTIAYICAYENGSWRQIESYHEH